MSKNSRGKRKSKIITVFGKLVHNSGSDFQEVAVIEKRMQLGK